VARVDTRLRAWGWLTRRMVPIATMKEADVIAMQARPLPKNAVTNWLSGSVPAEVETTDRRVPGAHGRDLRGAGRRVRPAQRERGVTACAPGWQCAPPGGAARYPHKP